MDEVLINANQLENSAQSTAACLQKTTLPFTVDPVLWRFQLPKWWRNEKGETKKNYRRLGDAYVRGTSIKIAAGPLLETVPSDGEWRTLAGNVMRYQRRRLVEVPTQLDLLDQSVPRELHPTRLMAPALVAYSSVEDRINRLLVDASASSGDDAIAAQVIVPPERLADVHELDRLVASIPIDGISAYFVWTPEVSEELLLADQEVLAALLHLISALANRGIAVAHQSGNYSIAALHDVGVGAVAHHLGWVDKGEPAAEQRFMLRSCQTYVPGVRHCQRFPQASQSGRGLDAQQYAERYCECSFCAGSFAAGQHPLDLLLEDELVNFSNGQSRRTPTSRAVAANTWHYLLSRRLEIQAFSERPAAEVIEQDIARATALAGDRDKERLRRLANEIKSA
ncbi:MAG: hypothetical protein M3082_17430 [Candidatus Dormibacteraeota bacterium]|nr:hypothetical protein [Candidatus Dormibacteraeota bacterium]